MSELTITNTSGRGVASAAQTNTGTPSKEDVKNKLANLDGESRYTIGDVVVLGNMTKSKRAEKLGLDANKYDVKVDSNAGIVNILVKTGDVFESWLRLTPENNISAANSTNTKKPVEVLEGANKDLVNKYSLKFRNMNTSEIANMLQEQINGLSQGEKTLSMFDAIPDDKLLDVYKNFSNKVDKENSFSSFFNSGRERRKAWCHCPLLMQMYEEYSVSKEELYARIKRVINICNLNYEKKIYFDKGNFDNDSVRTLVLLENNIAKILGYSEPFSATNGGGYSGYQLTER